MSARLALTLAVISASLELRCSWPGLAMIELVGDRDHACVHRALRARRPPSVRLVAHFAGQQHAAVEAGDVGVAGVADDVAQLVARLHLDRAIDWCPRSGRRGCGGPTRRAPPEHWRRRRPVAVHQPVSEVSMAPRAALRRAPAADLASLGQHPGLVIHILLRIARRRCRRKCDVWSGQMDFLDAGGAVGRHADLDVGVGQHLADGAAALAGHRHDAHFALERGFDGGQHVGRVARRRRSPAGCRRPGRTVCTCLGEDLAGSCSRWPRAVRIEVSVVRARAGSGKALALEAPRQLGGEVLGGRRREPPPAAGEDLVAVGQRRRTSGRSPAPDG